MGNGSKKGGTMREILQPYIEESAYKQILSHYHFHSTDEAEIRFLTKRLLQDASPAVYFGRRMPEEESRLAVLVTLGAGVDELQEAHTVRGELMESYMIECIAMELLKNAYEQTADIIYRHCGFWMGGFDFLGDTVPIERMEEVFAILNPAEITYNQAYMLTPKKTVAFYTTLTDSRKKAYCNVCSACSHTKCVHRRGNLTYGYQRIFGEYEIEGT